MVEGCVRDQSVGMRFRLSGLGITVFCALQLLNRALTLDTAFLEQLPMYELYRELL